MSRTATRGFTLIEMVMVIVITGVLAGMVAVFIAKPVEGYVNSVRHAELTDAADTALRRLARDVRLALPNSLRVTTVSNVNYIEFISTSAGGRYRDASDGSSGGSPLSFTNTATNIFNVLGPMPSNPALAAGDYIVVFNLGVGYNPANAYNYDTATALCRAGGCNIAQVSSVSSNTVTLAANPFAAQTPPLPSPGSRFQVVPFATQAVTYACPSGPTAGNFNRYSAYGFIGLQPTPPAATPALLAANATCVVNYTQNAQQRNGIISINLTLTDPASQDKVSMFYQIHVDNSP
ncbi:MAG: type II secretion system protein [Betaproteobacteria bacterium]|nr:type II secretion system protein [Betaproteobacteria bacterium]